MRSRRSVIAAGLSGVALGGCLGNEDDGPLAPGDEPADIGDPVPGGPVPIAHWAWTDRNGPAAGILDTALPTPFVPELNAHADRAELEAAVADSITTGRPPASFQTVAGRELDRYAIARTIHDLEGITPDPPYRPGVAEAIRPDGDRYAVPATVECRNRLAVSERALDEHDVDLEAIEMADALPDALDLFQEGARVAVPGTAAAQFQLFCLELLATTGAHGFAEIDERAPRIGTIAPAVESLASVADRVEREGVPGGSDDVIGTLGSGTSNRGGWVPLRWPGTAGTVSVSVTGFPFPKRSPNAHGTVEFLSAMSDPGVQTELAALAGAVPAGADASVPSDDGTAQAQVDWLEGASTVVPSPATGCGLDPDQRRRAIAAFGTNPVDEMGTDEFSRVLRDALS